MYIKSKFTFLSPGGKHARTAYGGGDAEQSSSGTDRSALDKPAPSSIPHRAVERGSAFSPYFLYTTVFLKIHSFLCSPYRPQVQPKSEEPSG